MKREDIKNIDIDIMQVTITSYVRYWSSEQIYMFLKQIEGYKGFKGFHSVSFDVDELPKIVCFFKLEDKEILKKRLSKLSTKK